MRLPVISRTGLVALAFVPTLLLAQDRRTHRMVTRANAAVGLSDVEISVLGQTRLPTVRTNAECRYTITAPEGAVRLQARLIGHTP